jgi:hypothetical protein
VRDHVAQDLVRARTECTAQPRDIGFVGAERRGDRGVVGDVVDLAGDQPFAELVPLELVRRQDRDEIVDIGSRRDEHGERLPAIPAQGPAATARAHDLPALDRKARRPELDRALTEHDSADVRHAVGKARGAVREGGQVGIRVLGAEVQARARVEVCLLEGAHADVAAGPK